jgi:hypothetical protein
MPTNLTKRQEEDTLRRIWDAHFWSRQSRDNNFMPRYRAAMRSYYDQTLDERNQRLIMDRGQSTISINWLRILLRKMQAYMTANQPQWTAFGVNDDDTRSAKLVSAILGHGWRISKGYLQIVDMLKKGLVGGLGLWSCYIDYKADGGLGEVKWRSLPIQFFYPDWRSMDQMYDDMSFQQISFTVDLATAVAMLPKKYHKKLKELSTVADVYDTLIQEGAIVYGQHPDPYEMTRVRLLTHYQLEERPLWELKDLSDGSVYYVDNKPDLPLPYAVDIKRRDIPSLAKYDCVYGMGEDDGLIYNVEYFPYDKFLMKPFINEFTENPYGIGEAYFLNKLQQYVDKSLRVALQHEMWGSNPGVFLPQGISNRPKVEKDIVAPGFVIEMDMDDGKRPYFKQSTPGQSGFYNIMNIALDAMQQSTGNMFKPEMARGNATEDQLLKMQGQEQGDALFRQFESTLENGAEAYTMMARKHYTHPKLLKFVDKTKRPAVLQVNRPFINAEGEVDGYYIKEVGIDIVMATKSYAPNEKFLKARQITEAMNRAPAEALDILFIELIKAMELDPEIVEEVQLRVELVPKLLEKMQQMSNSLEQMQSQNQTLQGQVFTADRKAVRATYEAELATLVKRFKSDMQAATKIWKARLDANEQIQKQISREQSNVGQRQAKSGQPR